MSRTIRIKAQYSNNKKTVVKWIDKDDFDTSTNKYDHIQHQLLVERLKAQIGRSAIKQKIMVYLYKSGSNKAIDYDYKFIRTTKETMGDEKLFDKITTFFK